MAGTMRWMHAVDTVEVPWRKARSDEFENESFF